MYFLLYYCLLYAVCWRRGGGGGGGGEDKVGKLIKVVLNDSLLKGTGVPSHALHCCFLILISTPVASYPPPPFPSNTPHLSSSPSRSSRIHQVSDWTQHGFNVHSIRSARRLLKCNGIVLPLYPDTVEKGGLARVVTAQVHVVQGIGPARVK